jgi:hypothetical protein
MQGRRVWPDERGFLRSEEMRAPGSYGRATRDFVKLHGEVGRRFTWWDVRAPDGSSCILNPSIHKVVEHEDGTITVHPSIVTDTWHGWLENGVWRVA